MHENFSCSAAAAAADTCTLSPPLARLPTNLLQHRSVPRNSSMYGFAVLYFTGSGQFNCSMRNFAKMKGLSLSDKGLKRVNRVEGKKVHSFPSFR